MKYFIDEIGDMIYGDWSNKILGLLLLVVSLAAIIFASWGIFTIIDSSYLKNTNGMAKIINKEHLDSYVSLQQCGKALIPISHPESWSATVELDSKQDSIKISKDFFNQVKIGQIVNIEYAMGRFSEKLYVKELTNNE